VASGGARDGAGAVVSPSFFPPLSGSLGDFEPFVAVFEAVSSIADRISTLSTVT
jgi:hypothetical protein